MPPNNRPLQIGITGNIGSGKTTFCKFLAERGLKVISADVLANQHLEDEAVKEALIKHYSPAILSSTNNTLGKRNIDHKILADRVFGNPNEINFLNSLIHPLVLRDFQNIAENSKEQIICFEVPLLFEANLQNCFDYIVLVMADENNRIDRLEHKGEDRTKAKKRIQHQISDEEKILLVDLVIKNDGDFAQLKKQAEAFIALLAQIKPRKIHPFI